MLNLWQIILLGAVQGATEFLPVSSSGHLVLAAELFNIPSSFAIESLLNIGTILAILIFFRKAIWAVTKDVLFGRLDIKRRVQICTKILIGVLPAALIGGVFSDFIEQHLHTTWITITMLFVVGCAMLLIKERTSKLGVRHKLNTNVVQDITYKQALFMGLAQPIALISGTSRSGITILAGLVSGLKIEAAATFSFLIGLPVIMGATLKLALSNDGSGFITNHLDQLVAGNIASFLVGMLAVWGLMWIMKQKGLKPFGVYRIALATIVALALLV